MGKLSGNFGRPLKYFTAEIAACTCIKIVSAYDYRWLYSITSKMKLLTSPNDVMTFPIVGASSGIML